MKPLELSGIRVKGTVHLFPEAGGSLCGKADRGRGRAVAVDGLEDPCLCGVCRERARGLSVVIRNK